MKNDEENPSPTYEVGYGKPPVSGRFKKGQRANPNGRGKGTKNALTILREEAEALITVNDGGRVRKMSKLRVGVRTAMNNFAKKGDWKIAEAYLKLEAKALAIEAAKPPEEPYSHHKAIIDQLFRDLVPEWNEQFPNSPLPTSD